MTTPTILQPGDGDVLSLPPPLAGQITIKSAAAEALAMAFHALPSGAALPSHRFLHADYAAVVLKGQGRVTVADRSATVVPGVSFTVPRGTWFSLRNTGTGTLQLAWTASTASVLAFYREAAGAGDVLSVAQRHGVEFGSAPAGSPAPEASAPGAGPQRGGRRRHRRGGRGRGRQAPPQGSPPPQAQPVTPSPAPVVVSEPPSAGGAPGPVSPDRTPRRRRRGRRGRGGAGGPAGGKPTQAAPATTAAAPQQKPKAPSTGQPKGPPRRGRRDRPYRGRVKEVYMGGRWVRVEGEGPVIATGDQSGSRQRRHRDGDSDTPSGPLSVPL